MGETGHAVPSTNEAENAFMAAPGNDKPVKNETFVL